MANLLTKIVTPKFIAFQAHCWFAYAVVFTFGLRTVPWALGAAAVKEFYIDKHFEVDQSFLDNLEDWAGYAIGTFLAVVAWRHFK